MAISVGPNSYFTPNLKVNILECADPGGTSANLPTSVSSCDGNTIQGGTVLINRDGSFSATGYTIYSLPNPVLGEQANWLPVCNATTACVLYVGQNQEDFTQPKLFSAPFTVAPAPKTASTSASGSSTTTTAASAGDPASSSDPSVSVVATSPASSASSLANTGPSSFLWLTSALGCLFIMAGAIGRRLLARGTR